MATHKWWQLSALVSLILAMLLVKMWMSMNDYEADQSAQLVDMPAVDAYLAANPNKELDLHSAVRIPTGIFIQSLKFFNSSEINITGYIWQHFPLAVHSGVADADLKPNFILPEQVNTASDSLVTLAYRKPDCAVQGEVPCASEVIGWYFEATLKQVFEYAKYPFDHKTVWVRLWPDAFSENIILVPDFSAYDSTAEDAIFGIEQSIVLGAWSRENTFFDYKNADYDTNFGIPSYVGQKSFPELHYNFVVKRRFDNAFIVYLLPLLLIAILLFAALLTVTECPKTSHLLGFNTSGFLGMCSALFFVVMIGHIQLREQFAGSSVVYLEYFYILMYLLLVGSTVNAYLFSIRPAFLQKFILYKDNLIPKITYWPFTFAVLDLVTYWVLHH